MKRVGCKEKVCWCHDQTMKQVPEFCSHCGCTVVKPESPLGDATMEQGRFWSHGRLVYKHGEMVTGFETESAASEAAQQLNKLDEIAEAAYTDRVLWDILRYHFKREEANRKSK